MHEQISTSTSFSRLQYEIGILSAKSIETPRLLDLSNIPYWFTPDIAEMQKRGDTSKRLKRWDDYRKFRNKTRQLIKHEKRKYFSESVNNCKDTKAI